MTERESEELYEELRRKLEGYGSTPPPDMWAAIQQQLPPATPELQRRPTPRPALRRRWALVGLLLLGVVLAVLMTRRPAGRPETAAIRPAASPVAPRKTAVAGTSVAPDKVTPGPAGSLPPNRVAAPFLRETTGPAAPATATAATATTAATPGATTAKSSLKARSSRSADREQTAGFSIAAAAGEANPIQPERRRATNDAEPANFSGKAIIGTVAPRVATRTSTPEAAPDSTPSVAESATTLATGGSVVRLSPVSAVTTASELLSGASRLPGGGNSGSTTQAEAVLVTSTQPASSSAQATGPETLLPRSAPASPLLPHTVLLQQLPATAPLVQAATLAPQLPRAPSRWAVEMLAGPNISYRRLGTTDSASISRLERPALAYAGQVQLRYTLRPRLTLSGGLGYTEYATRLNLLLQQPRDTAGGGGVGTTKAVQQRDTYRYFTVPVQMQYQLGSGTRLRYGLTAGASLDIYAGGRTSGTTTYTGEQQQTWSATNSPYRRLGLSLTAGLEVRYALTPRLTLLAQPLGRYSLLSISAGTSALPPRYPFAVGLLTGFSFGLR